ncbi:MAG: biosynthetic-type acetolactate synthase large subunit [Pseudobutyrivibrio ruminis]|uniref:biosynthetic-type acetolactate synthase large subunit n=1 Tax=Pseudobutyrivibrio ruminis TaxID=46206 RepID=UPI0026EAC1D8|nr:biosynthetic-type acetolactate synthase large subunit [Pseudobutyrivibrio ruminis]MBE5913803.1 biosynthetic-type acetolactate synthase large subunit [Pseudobutyrivibrio ruminis]
MALNITGRKLFVKALKEEGVDTIFAYPGGMITDIVDELYKTEGIRVILGRHEQALVHEAEGYARATGKTAVVLVTSGPGATNTITGIADAYYDSIPMVIFTGQVPLHLIGNDAFQEVDIVGMTRSITKYGVTIRDREDMGRLIKMGFQVASTGKPGPVLIDIPKDIQVQTGDPEYPEHVDIRGYHPNETVHIGQLKKAYRLLKSAKKPLILAGGGVRISGAEQELLDFATKMNVPVTTTVMGKGVMPENHSLFIGNCGMHGRFAANKAVTECDVLFSIGTRFNDRITGELDEFAPKAKIVHVDIASASISRNVVVDVPVTADAKIALERLVEYAEPMNTAKWLAKINEWESEHPLSMPDTKVGINPQIICEKINQVFFDANIVTDVGQHQMWATQFIRLSEGQEFITSGGLGTMGFGFPAAIGAAIGNPKKPVVLITGDGGFQMNMQEMATAMTEKIPVIICIFNNSNLGMVRQMQQLFYGKRYEITDLSASDGSYYPDFIKWAEGYSCKAIRVTNQDDVLSALETARANTDGPTVLEFIVSPDDLVLPMVKSGTPLSEMILK